MRFGFTVILGFAVASTAIGALPAHAQSAGDVLRRHAYAGTLAAGEPELVALAARNRNDPEAATALGMARFALALERLGRSFYRHGLGQPEALRLALPILRMPVPDNPNPEALSYDGLRVIYRTFLDDLAGVGAALQNVPAGEFKLSLDLTAIRLDLNGDGKGDDVETLGAIVSQMIRNRRDDAPQPWPIAFDRADAIWLAGYSHLLSAVAEFVLAHDWRETFLATGHLFFPRIEGGSPIASLTRLPAWAHAVGGPNEAGQLADFIAALHLIRWPLAESARMGAVRAHLLEVVRLSRANWDAILAETDDDAEWLPNPRQQGAFGRVTDDMIAGWRRFLDRFEDVLEGRMALAHWRFAQGIDLRKVFEEPRPFDLVLWFTGHAALPYLKEGPMITEKEWNEWERVFRRNFLGFAAWAN